MSDHRTYPAAERIDLEPVADGMALRVYENSRTVCTEAVLTQKEAWDVARRLGDWAATDASQADEAEPSSLPVLTSTDLVGPVSTIRFHDGTRQAYDVPQDTRDPRFKACAYHHPGCDCREAERSEQINELRGELKGIADAARKMLEGHAIWAYEDGPNGERQVGCMCTGCQIVRASYVLRHSEGDSHHRDETDGLSPDEVDYGYRWKICTDRGGACDARYRTRDRGNYHEHLAGSNGEWIVPVQWDEVPF